MQDITEVTVGPADLPEVIFDGTVIVVTGTAGSTRVTFVGDARPTRELLNAVAESGEPVTALISSYQISCMRPIGVDSENWACTGCGGQYIGRRPASDRCRDCQARTEAQSGGAGPCS
jgi:hypothetical protein